VRASTTPPSPRWAATAGGNARRGRFRAGGAAAAVGALVGPAQAAARLIEKLLGGRFHPIWTMLASTGLVAAGLGLLWAGIPAIALALLLYGAGIGVGSIARGTLPLALFGSTGYATLIRPPGAAHAPGRALAPIASSFLLARPGGAQATLAALAVAAVVNLALAAAPVAQPCPTVQRRATDGGRRGRAAQSEQPQRSRCRRGATRGSAELRSARSMAWRSLPFMVARCGVASCRSPRPPQHGQEPGAAASAMVDQARNGPQPAAQA